MRDSIYFFLKGRWPQKNHATQNNQSNNNGCGTAPGNLVNNILLLWSGVGGQATTMGSQTGMLLSYYSYFQTLATHIFLPPGIGFPLGNLINQK
jgi:hypothetical protein